MYFCCSKVQLGGPFYYYVLGTNKNCLNALLITRNTHLNRKQNNVDLWDIFMVCVLKKLWSSGTIGFRQVKVEYRSLHTAGGTDAILEKLIKFNINIIKPQHDVHNWPVYLANTLIRMGPLPDWLKFLTAQIGRQIWAFNFVLIRFNTLHAG